VIKKLTKFKHGVNSIIEACAEILKRDKNFNPKQVLRYFHLFPIDGFEDLLDIPSNDYENWYYLRDSSTHMGLLFNYETREYVLLENEEKWINPNIDIFKKSEEELTNEENLIKEKIEELKKTYVGKRIIPVIKWYFSSPILSILDDTPKEFIIKLLKKKSRYFEIENENINNLTELLFEAYFREKIK